MPIVQADASYSLQTGDVVWTVLITLVVSLVVLTLAGYLTLVLFQHLTRAIQTGRCLCFTAF